MPEEQYEYNPDMPALPMQMPGNRSDEVYSAMLQERRMENVLDQLNPERLIVEIEYRLKGYRKEKGNWKLIGKQEKKVSEELLSDILSILSSVLANNTSVSNYQPDEINKIMKTLGKNLVDAMREKDSEYGLEDNYAERKRIMFIIGFTVFATMKQAQGGHHSKRLFDSIQVKDSFSQQPQQRSGLGKIFSV